VKYWIILNIITTFQNQIFIMVVYGEFNCGLRPAALALEVADLITILSFRWQHLLYPG
jgi:hypothetical protein